MKKSPSRSLWTGLKGGAQRLPPPVIAGNLWWMNRRPGQVKVTTEVAYCSFCGRPRNLRREEHQLGTLVRTIITCETCHRTLSSSMGVATPEPAAEPAPKAAPEPVSVEAESKPKKRATKPAAKKAAAKPAAKKPAAAAKAKPAARKTTTKK